MLEEFLLGLTSLVGQKKFIEEDYTLQKGEQVIEASSDWNAMTIFSRDKVSALPLIYYKKDGEFLPWSPGEESSETGEHLHSSTHLELLIAGSLRREITIYSQAKADITIHYFNTTNREERLQAFDPFDDDSKDDPTTGLAKKVHPPKFITRAQWGADESLREWKVLSKLKHVFRSSVPEAKWATKAMQPKIITRYGKNGERLLWPIEESPEIEKFVIHHTGEFVDETRNPYELMRAIYSYHTITRGWGDIGYNYVIDKQGNIYEGRAGGPKTVGAHTAYHNLGSLGVSLMGNFQYEYPTARQIQVLTLLLAEHANRFRVNPLGKSYFLETQSDNITSHRDIARKGHGTACPGKNLQSQLPEIRKEAARLSLLLKKQDRHNAQEGLWQKSQAKPIFEAFWLEKQEEKLQQKQQAEKAKIKADNQVVEMAELLTEKRLSRNTRTHLAIKLQNNSRKKWPKGTKILVSQVPEGMTVSPFYLQVETRPGYTGKFLARVKVDTTPNGIYSLHLKPDLKLHVPTPEFDYPIRITPDLHSLIRQKTPIAQISKATQVSILNTPKAEEKYGKDVKIKLAFFDEKYALIESPDKIKIRSQDNKELAVADAKSAIRVIPPNNPKEPFQVTFRQNNKPQKISIYNPKFDTVSYIQILNYSRKMGTLKYNEFRDQLNFIARGNKNFWIINQLPMELYLRGLAEEPSTEPNEKKHAIHILARSYAYVYSGSKRKFGTPLFDLEDDPASSQFYLGYEWERYHPEQIKLLEQTKGKVITYRGNPVIGPYFTQSGGESSDKWQKQYPWTQKQKLPYDEGLEPRGHGVGLSGNTARKLAQKGHNHEQILKHFFRGIKIEKIY